MKQPNRIVLLSACRQGSGHRGNLLVVDEWLNRNGYNPIWATSNNQPELVYYEDKLSLWKSFKQNLGNFNGRISEIILQKEKVRAYQPLAVITDFEPILAQAAAEQGVLSINISSQPIFFGVEHPISKWLPRLLYETKLRGSVAWSHHNLVPTFIPFTQGTPTKLKMKFYGPLIRSSLHPRNRSPKTFEGPCDLVAFHVTKELANLKQHIISYLPFKTVYNFNRHHFDDILEHCDYVICTGGHNLLAECIYLKKPALIFPIPNHYEQYLNAISFVDKGYGMIGDPLDIPKSIDQFKRGLSKYRSNLIFDSEANAGPNKPGNQSLFADLSILLKEEEQKKLREDRIIHP